MGNAVLDVQFVQRYARGSAQMHAALGLENGAEIELHRLGMGEHNLNYWFAEPGGQRKFVLRVNVASQPFHDDQVAYEFSALEALLPSGRTPAPLYLDNGPAAPGEGALVISFCEGRELDFDALQPGDLQCAAQIMADVHAVPVAPDCTLFRPRDPLRDLFGECLQRFKLYRSSAFEDARITKWAETFIAAAEEALRTTCDPADCTHIVNTETLPSHFLIPESAACKAVQAAKDGRSGRFCTNPGSFVDWERPIIGEVAQDVAYFASPTTTFWDSEFLFPASKVDAFVEDYWRAVDGRFTRGNFDERFRAFRMMTALRSVTWCCRALIRYRGEAGGHTTAKTAQKLPIYLSDDFMELLAAECFDLRG